MRIGFIGLGVMGDPMAGHLHRAGHEVVVYNRTTAKAEAWVDRHGGRRVDSPAEAATDAEVVMTIVGNDDDVRAVTLGPDGAVGAMAAGAVLIDHTTASAGLARELGAACGARGLGFLDAPVSGGEVGAQRGTLTVMAGGDPDTFAAMAPVMEAYAANTTLIGPTGTGQLTKMVNQVAIAGVLQGLSEALHLATRAGLDTDKVLATIGKGAAGSWQMDNRGATMVADAFDFGFAIDWMRKDLGIALTEARALGASLPVAALVDQFYATLQTRGAGRRDTSALIQLLNQP